MKKPKISVVIPVYNVEKHLRKCLDSVVGQTYHNLEIILIDDGSIDQSPEICDEYVLKDNRFICIHQKNQGVSVARNMGIEIATGDYYHFLDSDDYMSEDAYEFLLSKMREQSTTAICFEYYITYLDGTDLPHSTNDRNYGSRDTKGALYEHLFGGSDFLCTKLLPKESVKSIRLRTDIFRDEDTIFAMEAIAKTASVYFSSRPLLHYVQSEESACRGTFRVNQLSAIKAIPIMEEFLLNGYSDWINMWRKKYMNLMTTLYRDMYLDGGSYKNEKNLVYSVFIDLWKKGGIHEVRTKKERLKFYMFRISPNFYCLLSKYSNNL